MSRSEPLSKTVGWTLLLSSLAVILIGTQLPFTYSAHFLRREPLWVAFEYPLIWEPIANVVMFLPFGFGFAVTVRMTHPGRLWTAILLGAVTSISIEAAQIYLPRVPSLLDIIANSSGTFLGATVYLAYQLAGPRLRSIAAVAATAAAILAPLFLLSGGPIRLAVAHDLFPETSLKLHEPVLQAFQFLAAPVADAYRGYLELWTPQ